MGGHGVPVSGSRCFRLGAVACGRPSGTGSQVTSFCVDLARWQASLQGAEAGIVWQLHDPDHKPSMQLGLTAYNQHTPLPTYLPACLWRSLLTGPLAPVLLSPAGQKMQGTAAWGWGTALGQCRMTFSYEDYRLTLPEHDSGLTSAWSNPPCSRLTVAPPAKPAQGLRWVPQAPGPAAERLQAVPVLPCRVSNYMLQTHADRLWLQMPVPRQTSCETPA